MSKYNSIITTSIKNMREAMNDISIDKFVVSTIEALMQIERTEYLVKFKQDKGNGYYSRAFRSLRRNSLTVNIPRTRTGDFSPAAVELIKLNKEQVNNLTLELLKKGMTTGDISGLLEEFFGESVSKTKITNLAKSFNEIRLAWENSPLESYYKAIFCDVLYITVKRGRSYSKEGVFVAYGVRKDNYREILALDVNPTESAIHWEEIFKNIKLRGVKRVDLVVADGLAGLENTVGKIFPEADFQKCVVHKMRNVLNKVRPKEKAVVAEDLKELFNNFEGVVSITEIKNKLKLFREKWQKSYPGICRKMNTEDLHYYFSYINYDSRVRRMIYTTNSVENINRIIRKATKNKLSFESPERLLDYVFMAVKEFEEQNLMKYAVYEYKYFSSVKGN